MAGNYYESFLNMSGYWKSTKGGVLMHPDNKILISAVLILGIALVSFNIGGFTGQISKKDCTPLGVVVRQTGPGLEAVVTM